MVTDKIKQYIFKRLYKELGNAEIIPYNNSIWFIDRNERYWYFELENNGNLYWRYNYFTNFFSWFSLEPNQFEPIISEWVEEVLNHKVSTTGNQGHDSGFWVEDVLNHKVSTTWSGHSTQPNMVEQVLNHKVSTTIPVNLGMGQRVKDVLNHKVETTKSFGAPKHFQVDKVLNHKVSTTHLSLHNLHDLVEDVLNENPTE